MEQFEYFFYKNGKGNFFQKEDFFQFYPGLYVGFNDLPKSVESMDKLESEYIENRSKGENEFFKNKKSNDDDLIAWLLYIDRREKKNLVVFDSLFIYFYEITNDLFIIRENPLLFELKKLIQSQKSNIKNLYIFKIDPTLNIEEKYKFLPVKLLNKIPRTRLYAPINSIAVYQYLNQGTCRPFAKIGKTENRKLLNNPNIENNRLKQKLPYSNDYETDFGVFIRCYFNTILGRKPNLMDLKSGLNDTDLILFTISTFNPSMMETACFYFCMDIGLLPESVNANSLDYVDIRSFPLKSYDEIFKKFKESEILLTERIKEKFVKNNLIEFQCKAYGFSPTSSNKEELIHFLPRKKSQKEFNTIGIQELVMSEKNFPYLYKYVQIQISRVFGENL
ncbi:hypothetical protein ND861_19015 [Leptospira sp. 2 VSF19]|uniref:FRG domain-containing protein n=1 Tax=Leptospira soteropolitanensis TaxID=2950025 RepID=A0AAW5VLS5_9LEPT|nr:hypothetical protein [Leptospira soteropolitanensis]MCW7494756.1 hypothetical protein [Leptospira soteropolitanensis]MCW7502334.1 hypothetical protein [Leptospira soteropolitanensis]MCW7524586.1 hypothetical protein [Leptospira soteropolitanensis]MCW7528456.1 hypothetical protein [Leptospira soteropolitanensis]MCW7532302.1 hypothetical protein [Leptospira soteropolitanensis]